MSSNVNVSSSQSILPALLLVLFVGLKLAGIIAWSWWWVLSPLWIPLLFAFLILGVVALVVVFRKQERRSK